MSFSKISHLEPDFLPCSFGGDHHFEKLNSFTGKRRHYRIRCSLTLWGEYAVERSWSGNTLKQPATRTAYFQTEAEALYYLQRMVAGRLRIGYLPSGFGFLPLFQAATA